MEKPKILDSSKSPYYFKCTHHPGLPFQHNKEKPICWNFSTEKAEQQQQILDITAAAFPPLLKLCSLQCCNSPLLCMIISYVIMASGGLDWGNMSLKITNLFAKHLSCLCSIARSMGNTQAEENSDLIGITDDGICSSFWNINRLSKEDCLGNE